jgi:hypothetical protein
MKDYIDGGLGNSVNSPGIGMVAACPTSLPVCCCANPPMQHSHGSWCVFGRLACCLKGMSHIKVLKGSVGSNEPVDLQ